MGPVIIIGAGLAGLTSAILLSKKGFEVTVIEKKAFPFHRVCGEYVSNEVRPFLESIGINISELNPSSISRLSVSSVSGKRMEVPLHSGGFGISRYIFDECLYKKAKSCGIEFVFARVNTVHFEDNEFRIVLDNEKLLRAQHVIGAFGKRSNLDQKLNRRFFYRRSPYMGVKYHIQTNFPNDLVQLDNFDGGYCGTCKIEDDKFNLCYLSETSNLKKSSSIAEMEQRILYKNPYIKRIFENSDFVFDKPEVITEISFERKSLVEDHILFCGDAAGMISPICGNGMAMAIHSAKILAECIIESGKSPLPAQRALLESKYQSKWEQRFAFRLKMGRMVQNVLLNSRSATYAISVLKHFPSLSAILIKNTHGKPII